MKKGVSFERILDDVRDSFNAESQKLMRCHLVSKKDLHNIASCYNIAFRERFARDDYSSVETMVETYQEKFKDDTPFKLFKKQGLSNLNDPEGVTEEDFLLVVMTSAQKKVRVLIFKELGQVKR